MLAKLRMSLWTLWFCKKIVDMPAHITIVGEKHVNLVAGEATDTLVKEQSPGDCYPDQAEIPKRRKLTLQENAEAPLTTEITKIVGNAKTEEQSCQYVRSGRGQLIAFTRRKKATVQPSPDLHDS